MKTILLLSLSVMLAACASRNEPVVRVTPVSVPGTTLPSEGIESVRYAEDIKAYSLGRYVDPNNPGIMHEAHTIYQVETTAKWNLHPNAPVSFPLGPVRVRDSAKTTTPVANELIVELNQQKEATKSIMQGGQLVSQKLSELANKLQQTQQIVTQNAQLKQEVDSTAQRLDALEEQLREQQGANHTASPDNIPKDTPSDW
jgi:polyhydroxyalkanoate synthesis regulator phasin